MPSTRPPAGVAFRYGGVDYLIRPPVEWMHEARDLLAASQPDAAIRLVLGGQYDDFRATRPKVGDVAGLFAALGVSAVGHAAGRHAAPRRGVFGKRGRS